MDVTYNRRTINIDNLVNKDEYDTIISYNVNGIFTVIKNELLKYYTDNNYKGKCTNYVSLYGFREDAKGDSDSDGAFIGCYYGIKSGYDYSFFLEVGDYTDNRHFNNTMSKINGAFLYGKTKPVPPLEILKVEIRFAMDYTNKPIYVHEYTYTGIPIIQNYEKIYLVSESELFNFDIIPLLGVATDKGKLELDGSHLLWNSIGNSLVDYAKKTIKEKYGVNTKNIVKALPLRQQNIHSDNIYMNWFNVYVTPMPVIYNPLLKTGEADNVITDIIDNDNSSWSDETIDYPINSKTNWKVYIDGTKLPNYKIVWENKDIEDSKDTDNARIQIQYAEVDPEYPVELRVPELIHETNFAEYNDGNYKTNFRTLYEGAWGEVYDEGILAYLPKQSVWLLLQLDYYKNGITTVLPTQSSTKMAVLLNPSGKSLYSYADVWNTDGSTDGSTIRVITDKGSGEGDDGYKDDTDKGEEDITDGASNSVGVLTTTYAMTIERLNQLGGFLWGANIFDEFSLLNSNPIENIISCKNIPISLSGTDEIIHLGNVDTGTNGAKVASNFSTLNVGQIALPTKYNSFLDFAPYTKITIYLPYIGFKEIDATIAIGKTLKVAYVADVITGGCIAQLFINGVRFYEFSGEMGVDIPITASNRAQVEASYISNAVGMGASLASGNITGAVDSVLASATAKYNYSSTDTPNPNCVASVNRTCYVIIERPTYQELSQFNHTKGKMCNLSKTIGSLKGFTICDSNIDLKGICATEQEKQEISSILSSGFFA